MDFAAIALQTLVFVIVGGAIYWANAADKKAKAAPQPTKEKKPNYLVWIFWAFVAFCIFLGFLSGWQY